MYSAFAAEATLNSHRIAGPLVRLVEEKERWEAPGPNVFREPRSDFVKQNQKRMLLLPKEVGEKGFLESRSLTFRIDSSGKGMRRTGFEDPD
ncbi:hypothetical protein TNCV_3895311 [Trichonephila clavipes]|nr:hypothetical protein TNCV_3895311 [Trichonephila clavipes]